MESQLKTQATALVNVLNSMQEGAVALRDKLADFKVKLKSNSRDTEYGLSFLDMKNLLLAEYCTTLLFYAKLKVEGTALEEFPVVDRLVRLRTFMERIRPIDSRMTYQVDKLLKAANNLEFGADLEDEDESLGLKPNPQGLIPHRSVDGDAADNLSAEHNEKARAGIYQAPKFAAMPYEDSDKVKSKLDKAERRRQKKLENSAILSELRAEFSSKPEEMSVTGANQVDKQLQAADKERIEWEEDRFVRSVMSRKEKQERRRKEREASRLETVADIDDFGALERVLKKDGSRSVDLRSKRGRGDTRKRNTPSLSSNVSQTASKMSAQGDARTNGSDSSSKRKKTKVSFGSLFG